MEAFLQTFTDYGAPFLLLGVAIWGLMKLFNRLEALHTAHAASNAEKIEKMLEVISDNTTALRALVDVVNAKRGAK